MNAALVLLLLGLASGPVAAAARKPSTSTASPVVATGGDFEVRRLADGVYAVVRTYPPGLMCDGNSVFIVNDDDVVVVDAPEASRDVIAALRTITRKPVTCVINTHWHDDHVTGNHVFRDSFPGVEFVGHPALREYLPTTGATNRKQMIEGAPQYVAYLRGLVKEGKSPAGGDLTAEERAAYETTP